VFVVEVVVGTLVVLALAVGLAAIGGAGLPDDPPDSRDAGVPDGRLMTSADVARLRLRTGLRGYRMDDVDRALTAAEEALKAAESRGEASQ
jgi:DivIVA domain-containing protein